MRLDRPTTEKDRRGLKLATQRTVQLSGGQDSAASITRVGRNTLSDYSNTGNPRHEDTFIPVDVLADLIEFVIAVSSICGGSGNCTRIPWISSSSLS